MNTKSPQPSRGRKLRTSAVPPRLVKINLTPLRRIRESPYLQRCSKTKNFSSLGTKSLFRVTTLVGFQMKTHFRQGTGIKSLYPLPFNGRSFRPGLLSGMVSVRQLGGELQRVRQWKRFQSRRYLPGKAVSSLLFPFIVFKLFPYMFYDNSNPTSGQGKNSILPVLFCGDNERRKDAYFVE